MKYGKLDSSGIVIQTQPYDGDGFEQIPDHVCPGYQKQQDGSFAVPPPSLSTAIQRKIEDIEEERVKHCEEMPFTIPSSGKTVQVKVKEEPPTKPRKTWLAGKAAKAESRIRRGMDLTDPLYAADDQPHAMNAEDWLALGEALDDWVQAQIDTARRHVANVEALVTVKEIQSYDIAKGWPS